MTTISINYLTKTFRNTKLHNNTYFTSSLNHESFLNGTSATYIEEMHQLWQTDPKQVHPSWDIYFRNVEAGLTPGSAYISPPTMSVPVGQSSAPKAAVPSQISEDVPVSEPKSKSELDEATIREYFTIQRLISSFRMRGHLAATVDPLGIVRGEHLKKELIQQHIFRHYQLPKDRNKSFLLHDNDFISGGEKYLTLNEIIKRLEDSYCGNIGIEYMHVTQQDKLDFIRYKFETPGVLKLISPEEKKLILQRLCRGHDFEYFLFRKYPAEKRFGLEGGEVLIPALMTLIDTASSIGVDTFNIGIAHRGRLNILANVVRKPIADIFALFRDVVFGGLDAADVKYHLGTTVERVNFQTKRPVKISLLPNPSHLEAVCPIVLGKTHSNRVYAGDEEGEKVWSILIHGDAATSGQGVVYETFHLSELPCFTNYGSIHVIVNNQIGFTTDPRMARSSEYCTEVAKVSSAPIFHVNGDDPEATCYVMKVAAEFKQKFKSDVVVDIYCYRRHGHNEADQPKFTQPLMYKIIEKLPPVHEHYTDKLLKEGVINKSDLEDMERYSSEWLDKGFEDAQKITSSNKEDWLDTVWDNFFTPDKDPLSIPKTGVDKNILLKIGEAVSTVPDNFEAHPALVRILRGRKEMIAQNNIDWALGESMAIGSLISEGCNVRLTGQDVERGTFSHRHHVYHHQTQDQVTYRPLNHVFPEGATYKVCNSSLSEFGVLGFQLGYSIVNPNDLVIWEAQFGDFVNSAQIIIDQFLSSGEAKWGRQCGMVVLLPHGLEGQGPEHSSAYPPRFLQMCSEPEPNYVEDMPQQLLHANWFIANVTTPANLFHILRRQIKLNFRKPLIVFTPKSLLRHPLARSSLDEMTEGTEFIPYIRDESITDPSGVERVLLCTGKVYYELLDGRAERKLTDKIALCRVEQLFPFPYAAIREDLKKYSKAKIFWAQEEQRNHGWWHFVQPRISFVLDGGNVEYLGRKPAPSPATGSKVKHKLELEELMNMWLTL